MAWHEHHRAGYRSPGINDVESIESQTSVLPTSLGHWAWERSNHTLRRHRSCCGSGNTAEQEGRLGHWFRGSMDFRNHSQRISGVVGTQLSSGKKRTDQMIRMVSSQRKISGAEQRRD